MGIKEILHKLREKKELRERYSMERRIAERYEEKKISANERELIRFKEAERQARIKKALEYYRKKENQEIFTGRSSNPAFIPYVVKDNKELYSHGSLFKSRKFSKK